ncbi:MAG: hypothetical protein QXU45_05945 [Candidatus Bathyarchaeia archaeon]
MSDSDVASVIGSQGYWILPEEMIKPLLEPMYPSGTQAQRLDTVTFCPLEFQRMFDTRAKVEFFVLNVPKNMKAIDETEGILSALASKLAEQNIEPVDLVKKVWKTSE